MKKESKNLTLIFVVVLIDLIGFGIIIPILPRYSEIHFGANEFQIGVLIASYSFFQFISTPVLGKLSDHYGRKPIIVFSLLLTTISYLIFAFAPNYIVALFSRSVAGIGGGSISAAQAYIADITEKKERAKGMGLIGTAFGLGFVLGPIIGGSLSIYGYIIPNLSAALLSFIALILTLNFLEESLINKKTSKINTNDLFESFKMTRYINTFSSPIVGKFILIFFIITFSIANTYGITPIFAYKRLHLTDSQIGSIYGIIGIVGVIFQGYLIGKLVRKYGEHKLMTFGMIFMVFGLFLVPFSNTFKAMIFFYIIIAMGLSLINPTSLSLISKYSPSDKQGQILGVNQSMGSLGRVLGPIWGGISFKSFGFLAPFLTASFFTLMALIIGITNITKLNKKEKGF